MAEGLFDLGITGRDWIEETASEVVSLGELQYSKASSRPFRIVLAVPQDSPFDRGRGPARRASGCRPSTPSSPGGSSRSAASRPTSGCPTAPPRPRCPTSSTASSRSPRRAGPCGLPGSRSSTTSSRRYTELVANPAAYADPAKRHAMEQLKTLLDGVMEARGKVLVKLNVGRGRPRPGDRAAAVDEVADGVEALRRRRLRGGDGRGQVRHQHADPRPQGRRAPATSSSSRSPRSSTGRHRRRGSTSSTSAGLGTVEATTAAEPVLPLHPDRRRHPHHRRRAVEVTFEVAAGHMGRWEATRIATV